MLFIVPYLFTLFYWVALFVAITNPDIAAAAFIGLCTLLTCTMLYVQGYRRMAERWVLWLNFCVYVIGSFLFVLILASPVIRNVYTIGSGVLAGFFIYIASRFLRTATP